MNSSAVTQIYLERLFYQTSKRLDLIDITPDVDKILRFHRVQTGFVVVQSLHTTAAIFINEFQEALLDDIKALLCRLVEQFGYWRHNDPKLSNCDRKNADAHLRAIMLGHTLSVPISTGRLALGRWQSIIMAELDGPRDRTILVQAFSFQRSGNRRSSLKTLGTAA